MIVIAQLRLVNPDDLQGKHGQVGTSDRPYGHRRPELD
jgi:hypothetical protein